VEHRPARSGPGAPRCDREAAPLDEQVVPVRKHEDRWLSDDPVPAQWSGDTRVSTRVWAIAGFRWDSDQGGEIFSLLRRQGIKNIAIMGISTTCAFLSRCSEIRTNWSPCFSRLALGVNLLTDVSTTPRQGGGGGGAPPPPPRTSATARGRS